MEKGLLPYYSHYLWLIPAYFIMISAGMLLLFSWMKRVKMPPGREIALLLLFIVGSMALSFFLLFCYYRFVQVQKSSILILFCIFYVLFIGLKFYLLKNFDRKAK